MRGGTAATGGLGLAAILDIACIGETFGEEAGLRLGVQRICTPNGRTEFRRLVEAVAL